MRGKSVARWLIHTLMHYALWPYRPVSEARSGPHDPGRAPSRSGPHPGRALMIQVGPHDPVGPPSIQIYQIVSIDWEMPLEEEAMRVQQTLEE